MKIIHSSDLHLNQKFPERMEALDRILELGHHQQADIICIAGDLFDSRADCDFYRPMLRQKFSQLPFKVLVIPGNHDYGSYGGDNFFGNDITIIDKKPFEVINLNQARLIAVPYYNQDLSQHIYQIIENKDPEGINILMLHCSLDAPFIEKDDLGEEQGEKYLPVSSKVLAELGFDYILAGHYHSRFTVQKISEASTFIYPGSPVSVTKKELGKRAVAVLDTKEDPPVSQAYVDSKYFDVLNFSFLPQKEDEVLSQLQQALDQNDSRYGWIVVCLDGFTSRGEKTLKAEIENIADRYDRDKIELNLTYRDVAAVLADPLYADFKGKLEKSELSEELKKDIDQQCKLYFSKLRMD